MNIIKFKDEINKENQIFNEKFKGKYAFLVHMRYAVSFDDMDINTYSACERGDLNILDYTNIDIDTIDIDLFVDLVKTKKVNSIDMLATANEYTTTPKLTIDDIKKFRTWLAESLYIMPEDYEEETKHMLGFYASNMYDDTIKYLELYGKEILISNVAKTGCNCCTHVGSDLSSLYNTNINMCDCVEVYKRGLHNKMVSDFSSIDFWLGKPEGFLIEFKSYIENILKLNLPINPSMKSDFVDCDCQQGINENKYNIILKNLITSLEYIINNNINGHKLFIVNSLNDWSNILYEYMIWE